jgi:hypothetical protein
MRNRTSFHAFTGVFALVGLSSFAFAQATPAPQLTAQKVESIVPSVPLACSKGTAVVNERPASTYHATNNTTAPIPAGTLLHWSDPRAPIRLISK